MYYWKVNNTADTRKAIKKLRLSEHCYIKFVHKETQLLFSDSTLQLAKTTFTSENKKQWLDLINLNGTRQVLSTGTEAEIRSRMHNLDSSWVEKKPPDELIEEIVLLLFSRTDKSFAMFLGRDIDLGQTCSPATASLDGVPFACDSWLGKRKYLWRLLKHEPLQLGDVHSRFANLKEWLNDPNARVILSISSGGVKCYGVSPILSLLDQLGVREHFDELWGTSGGAIVAQLYGSGVPPDRIEKLAYHIYQRRYPNVPFFRSKFRLP